MAVVEAAEVEILELFDSTLSVPTREHLCPPAFTCETPSGKLVPYEGYGKKYGRFFRYKSLVRVGQCRYRVGAFLADGACGEAYEAGPSLCPSHRAVPSRPLAELGLLADLEGGGKVALKVINLNQASISAKVELKKMKTLLNEYADRLYDGSEGSLHVQRIIAICESCPLGDAMRVLEGNEQEHQTLAQNTQEGLERQGGRISGKTATEVSIVVSELCANADLNFWLRQTRANGPVRVRFFEHLVKGLAHMMRHGCSLPPCSHIAAPVAFASQDGRMTFLRIPVSVTVAGPAFRNAFR